MNRFYQKVNRFIKKNYWIILAIVVSISYGWILSMFPWQDDHALMFKLAHINDKAGYLGAGLFGEGPYKYTAAYYYPIYLIFKYNNISAYFALSLLFYFLATLSVYKLFSEMIDKPSGRLASFIFACGYIASDGFIRLYNSVGTSLSIILISFLFLSYWKYFKKNAIKWYFSSLVFYFLAVEFVRYRTHYLIAVVVIFEFLFFGLKKPYLKSFFKSLLRLSPFVYIFYRYFIVAGDSRSGKVIDFIQAILRGELYQLYSFFSSITNLVFPDWLSRPILSKTPNYILSLFNGGLFSNPVLNLSSQEKVIPIIGIAIIIISIISIFREKKNQKLYFFFLFWMVINIISYSAYLPTHAYETTNRLLAHSFFALIGLFVLLSKSKKSYYFLIVFITVCNLINSNLLLKRIAEVRSKPAKLFYQELKNYVPVLKKGDVLYFDVQEAMGQNLPMPSQLLKCQKKLPLHGNMALIDMIFEG
jgi:hypothetical protein